MSGNKNNFLAKLDEFEARLGEVEKEIAKPEVVCDSGKLIALSKEQGKLRAIVTKYQEYKKTTAEIEDAQDILDDGSADEDFKSLAKEEIVQLESQKKALFEGMQNAMVMADEVEINSIIMEIRAGTGGDEAALFARDLYTMYVKYAENRRWRVEQLDFSATEKGGFREVLLGVKGKRVWSELRYESGGHRVQRVPETESQGRVHTSAATVAVLPEPQEVDIKIEPADVLEHVSRAGGPGGPCPGPRPFAD